MAKEPQSYGSQKDWVTGHVGETVNRQNSDHPPQHDDFYDSRRGSEESGEHQGGHVSDEQLAENTQQSAGATTEDEQPTGRINDQKSGAKRGGYFKDRDYK